MGDEAFLTTGLSSPFLYAKQGNTVIELGELARLALGAALDNALDSSDAGGGDG